MYHPHTFLQLLEDVTPTELKNTLKKKKTRIWHIGMWRGCGGEDTRKERKSARDHSCAPDLSVVTRDRQTSKAVGTKTLTAVTSYQQSAQVRLVQVLCCTSLILTSPSETGLFSSPCLSDLTSWPTVNQPRPPESRQGVGENHTFSLSPSRARLMRLPCRMPRCAGHRALDTVRRTHCLL